MSSYLLKIKGNYYFRIRIPQDVVHHFPSSEIKRSLRTKNSKNARSHARLWSSKVEQVFLTLRANLVASEHVNDYIHRSLPSIWKDSKKINVKTSASHEKKDLQVRSKQLKEVVEAYLQENIALGKWSAKTADDCKTKLLLLMKLVGNIPIKQIDRKMMLGYLETLKRLPAGMSYRPAYRDKSLKEILALKNVTPMSNTTVNMYLERAGSLFLWCIKQGDLDRNPVSGLSIAKVVRDDEFRSAYDLDDVAKIKNLVKKFIETRPERYWIPLIGIYSGMRLNEISQLYVEDVVQVDNLWCFDINENKDKTIKSLASKRQVPIHPALIDSGLLQYVDELKKKDSPRLWMNLSRGRDGHSHGICQWYRRFNRIEVTKDPLKVFHSFRHLLADTLKQSGVAEGVIAEILGHSNESITTGRYGKRFRPQVLLDALLKLNY